METPRIQKSLFVFIQFEIHFVQKDLDNLKHLLSVIKIFIISLYGGLIMVHFNESPNNNMKHERTYENLVNPENDKNIFHDIRNIFSNALWSYIIFYIIKVLFISSPFSFINCIIYTLSYNFELVFLNYKVLKFRKF